MDPADTLFNDLNIPDDEPFTDGGAPTAADPPPADPPAAGPPPAAASPEPPAAPATPPPPAPDPATPSTPAAPLTAPAADPPAQHMVPVATLVNERRAMQERLDAERTAREAAEAKLREQQPTPPVNPKAPDFTEDPKGYVDHQVQTQAQAVAKLQETTQQTAEQVQQQETMTRFVGALQADEQAFVTKTPDYHEALNHVRNVRIEQLSILHPGATREELVSALQREELALAAKAMEAGQSPADLAYRYARTLGYTGRQAAAAPPPATPPPAPATPPARVPGQPADLDAARRAAAQTLGAGGGGDGSDQLDDQEFDPIDQALKERFGRR